MYAAAYFERSLMKAILDTEQQYSLFRNCNKLMEDGKINQLVFQNS